MLTELELSKKREKKNLKRRAGAVGKARARASYDLHQYRLRVRLDAEELAKRNEAYEAARAKSRQAVISAKGGGKTSALEALGKKLSGLLPRRSGGAD